MHTYYKLETKSTTRRGHTYVEHIAFEGEPSARTDEWLHWQRVSRKRTWKRVPYTRKLALRRLFRVFPTYRLVKAWNSRQPVLVRVRFHNPFRKLFKRTG